MLLGDSAKMDGKWRLVWQLTNGRPLTDTLNGADLSYALLKNVDLSGMNLSGANLTNTDLTGADLSGANLSGADLTGANLSGADLTGVNFESAVLILTNLTEATVDLEALEAARPISEELCPVIKHILAENFQPLSPFSVGPLYCR
jgi:hypothetical protein